MGKVNGATIQKPKAERLPITTLVITAAYKRSYSTGSTGFMGKAIDPATGKSYQSVTAVEIKSKK